MGEEAEFSQGISSAQEKRRKEWEKRAGNRYEMEKSQRLILRKAEHSLTSIKTSFKEEVINKMYFRNVYYN